MILLQEIEGPLVEEIGHVPIALLSLAIDVDDWIEKEPLTDKTDPMIETGTAGVVMAHVPFADEGGFVTGLSEHHREGD